MQDEIAIVTQLASSSLERLSREIDLFWTNLRYDDYLAVYVQRLTSNLFFNRSDNLTSYVLRETTFEIGITLYRTRRVRIDEEN